MIAQSFENSQKSVFGWTLEAHMCMKGWFAKGESMRVLLSDIMALQNRRHFGSTMLRERDDLRKTPFFAN
jgi:hypothetical protein